MWAASHPQTSQISHFQLQEAPGQLSARFHFGPLLFDIFVAQNVSQQDVFNSLQKKGLFE
jgi:hypothetical protein